MPIAESRCDYEYNSSFRPIDKILFRTDWPGLLLNSIRMQRISFPRNKRRGEERTSAGRKNRRGSEEEEEKEGEGEGEGEWKNRETGRALRRDREGEG